GGAGIGPGQPGAGRAWADPEGALEDRGRVPVGAGRIEPLQGAGPRLADALRAEVERAPGAEVVAVDVGHHRGAGRLSSKVEPEVHRGQRLEDAEVEREVLVVRAPDPGGDPLAELDR